VSVEENKEIVRKYVQDLLIDRNYDHAVDQVGPNFKIDRSAMPEAIAGAEGLHRQMDMLNEAFPDLELQIADIFGEGDKVAVRFIAPGTHTGDFLGMAPTGVKVLWKGNVIYEVQDGRVQQAWACWDDVGLIQTIEKASGSKAS